jgi:hypothetical protein
MNRLTLTEEQTRLVLAEPLQLQVLAPNGEVLGYLNVPMTDERAAMLKKLAKEGPFLTTEEFIAQVEASLAKQQSSAIHADKLSGAA